MLSSTTDLLTYHVHPCAILARLFWQLPGPKLGLVFVVQTAVKTRAVSNLYKCLKKKHVLGKQALKDPVSSSGAEQSPLLSTAIDISLLYVFVQIATIGYNWLMMLMSNKSIQIQQSLRFSSSSVNTAVSSSAPSFAG